jgi:kynurenine formamidase
VDRGGRRSFAFANTSGNGGTHVDPPAHFVRGLRTVDYQIELLANLDQVPEAGALIIVSFPKPKDGSGFPARVFAICPQ